VPLPLARVAVGKTPGEPSQSVLRAGSEIGQSIRRTRVVGVRVVAHGRPGAHHSDSGPPSSRCLYPTASDEPGTLGPSARPLTRFCSSRSSSEHAARARDCSRREAVVSDLAHQTPAPDEQQAHRSLLARLLLCRHEGEVLDVGHRAAELDEGPAARCCQMDSCSRTDWVAGAYFRELAFSKAKFRDLFREREIPWAAASRIHFREHDAWHATASRSLRT